MSITPYPEGHHWYFAQEIKTSVKKKHVARRSKLTKNR